MKSVALLLITSLAFAGCQVKKTDDQKITATVVSPPVKRVMQLIGSYVGAFGNNKITVLITKNEADSVSGRSVVGGNDRPFTGTVRELNGTYNIALKEPGNDPHDGVFNLTIKADQPDMLAGNWQPDKPTATVQGKTFILNRKSFNYLQDVGKYPEASKKLLKEEDVENLRTAELELMRNEIFARHGFCFQKKALRKQFENQDWYVPITTNIKDDLTEIEKKNIVLIKRYEKYAEEFGDDFGR